MEQKWAVLAGAAGSVSSWNSCAVSGLPGQVHTVDGPIAVLSAP